LRLRPDTSEENPLLAASAAPLASPPPLSALAIIDHFKHPQAMPLIYPHGRCGY
jgi:hypothetical protein